MSWTGEGVEGGDDDEAVGGRGDGIWEEDLVGESGAGDVGDGAVVGDGEGVGGVCGVFGEGEVREGVRRGRFAFIVG